MAEDGGVWQLIRRAELVADLVVTGGDFPWLSAEVRPTTEFEEVRPLFDERLRQLDYLAEDPGRWERRRSAPSISWLCTSSRGQLLCSSSWSNSAATVSGSTVSSLLTVFPTVAAPGSTGEARPFNRTPNEPPTAATGVGGRQR
jgi:hypothetical protein